MRGKEEEEKEDLEEEEEDLSQSISKSGLAPARITIRGVTTAICVSHGCAERRCVYACTRCRSHGFRARSQHTNNYLHHHLAAAVCRNGAADISHKTVTIVIVADNEPLVLAINPN